MQLQPFDIHNQHLVQNVHPADWKNPVPDGRYNLVVVGAGTAGLVTAAGAAGLGAKVALVERSLMGGDCLNVGCVPSKAVISPSRVMATIHKARKFGIDVEGNVSVDFAAVMQRMRSIRASISHHDSAKRFKDLGVDVYLGEGKFTSKNSVTVAGQRLIFKKAVVATGARAAKLPIEGIDDVTPLTNETAFSLTELPERLTVVGAGPIGCELAQAFARYGAKVTLIEMAPTIMIREDPDAAAIIQATMTADGIELKTGSQIKRFEKSGKEKIAVIERNGSEDKIVSDEILVAIGRAPNVDGLGLENAGVEFDQKKGIVVNDKLRTSNKHIYAAGDVASHFKFTHAADFMARTVIQNALFLGRKRVSSLIIPWCTYTSPELAHVGMTASDAEAAGIGVTTLTQELAQVDRAILDNTTDGFARVHVKKGTDRIVGATIVAENAGEMISEITQAMTYKIGLGKIASTIHPYPTLADAIRKLGDQYNKTRLTPFIHSLFKRWLSWNR